MSMIIVKDGHELGVEQAVDWLEGLGIDRSMIRTVNVLATVGRPLMIQVALYVPDGVVTPQPEILLDAGQRMEDNPADYELAAGNYGPGQPWVPEPTPVRRDLCPCGAGFEHAGQGAQEQHADWIDRRPEDARDVWPGY